MTYFFSSDSIGPLQEALFVRITEDEALNSFFRSSGDDPAEYRVYDEVPQNPEFPYCVFDGFESRPFVTHGRKYENVTVELVVWSKAQGFKELETIKNALQNALFSNFNISVPDRCVTRIDFVSARLKRTNEDGEQLRYCELTFSVILASS